MAIGRWYTNVKIKKHVIYNHQQELLRRLFDEYRNYCGYKCKLERGKLTVFPSLDKHPFHSRVDDAPEDAKEEQTKTWESTVRNRRQRS